MHLHILAFDLDLEYPWIKLSILLLIAFRLLFDTKQ